MACESVVFVLCCSDTRWGGCVTGGASVRWDLSARFRASMFGKCSRLYKLNAASITSGTGSQSAWRNHGVWSDNHPDSLVSKSLESGRASELSWQREAHAKSDTPPEAPPRSAFSNAQDGANESPRHQKQWSRSFEC